jgi:hypothetical protein
MEAIQKPPILIRKEDLKITEQNLIIQLNGSAYTFAFNDISKPLAEASLAVKQNYRLSPSGYGLHWPDIDEDLSVTGLFKGIL